MPVVAAASLDSPAMVHTVDTSMEAGSSGYSSTQPLSVDKVQVVLVRSGNRPRLANILPAYMF